MFKYLATFSNSKDQFLKLADILGENHVNILLYLLNVYETDNYLNLLSVIRLRYDQELLNIKVQINKLEDDSFQPNEDQKKIIFTQILKYLNIENDL